MEGQHVCFDIPIDLSCRERLLQNQTRAAAYQAPETHARGAEKVSRLWFNSRWFWRSYLYVPKLSLSYLTTERRQMTPGHLSNGSQPEDYRYKANPPLFLCASFY
jgi:hypothetical protein